MHKCLGKNIFYLVSISAWKTFWMPPSFPNSQSPIYSAIHISPLLHYLSHPLPPFSRFIFSLLVSLTLTASVSLPYLHIIISFSHNTRTPSIYQLPHSRPPLYTHSNPLSFFLLTKLILSLLLSPLTLHLFSPLSFSSLTLSFF